MNKKYYFALRYLLSHISVVLLILLLLLTYHIYIISKYKVPPIIFKNLVSVHDYLAPRLEQGDIKELSVTFDVIGKSLGGNVWLSDTNGNTLIGTPSQNYFNTAIPFPLPDQKTQLATCNYFDGTSRIVVIKVNIQGQPAYLVADFGYSTVTAFLWQRSRDFIATPAIIGLLIATLLGFFMYNRLRLNIADITKAAKEFASGNYAIRTKVSGNDEIARLGQTFNTMADTIVHTQQTRREFFSNIAHELKTPLANIQCITESLQDGIATNDNERHQYFNMINDETAKLNRIVTNILDLERIETQQYHFSKQLIDLKEFLFQQEQNIRPLLHKKELTLTKQFNTTNYFILADPINLARSIENLLVNAIKFSPPTATINLVLTEQEKQLSLSISDHGPGIPESEIPFIGKRFYQSQQLHSFSAGGTGLGLAIARSLITGMGGSFEVSSIQGQGTTFTISFSMAHR
ncbi:MAG: integral rane sensor signal transduction histidine kinase [Firmicutes bacterium]|nr:integral rane sensor signal transduction histidine kinase [Bacillota bacterium]